LAAAAAMAWLDTRAPLPGGVPVNDTCTLTDARNIDVAVPPSPASAYVAVEIDPASARITRVDVRVSDEPITRPMTDYSIIVDAWFKGYHVYHGPADYDAVNNVYRAVIGLADYPGLEGTLTVYVYACRG